jgi:hypothetical protein
VEFRVAKPNKDPSTVLDRIELLLYRARCIYGSERAPLSNTGKQLCPTFVNPREVVLAIFYTFLCPSPAPPILTSNFSSCDPTTPNALPAATIRLAIIAVVITLLTLASANHLTACRGKWVLCNQDNKTKGELKKYCVEK